MSKTIVNAYEANRQELWAFYESQKYYATKGLSELDVTRMVEKVDNGFAWAENELKSCHEILSSFGISDLVGRARVKFGWTTWSPGGRR